MGKVIRPGVGGQVGVDLSKARPVDEVRAVLLSNNMVLINVSMVPGNFLALLSGCINHFVNNCVDMKPELGEALKSINAMITTLRSQPVIMQRPLIATPPGTERAQGESDGKDDGSNGTDG